MLSQIQREQQERMNRCLQILRDEERYDRAAQNIRTLRLEEARREVASIRTSIKQIRVRLALSKHAESKLMAAAIHEAGHAIIACVFGCQPVRLRILSDGSGECALNVSSLSDTPVLRILLAGPVASCHAGQKRYAWGTDSQFAADEKMVERRMGAGFQLTEQFNHAVLMAEFFVESLWSKIDALADELTTMRELDARALERFFVRYQNAS